MLHCELRFVGLRGLRRSGRKKNSEKGTALETIAAGDVAVVLADDAVAGAEPQPSSFPDGLGGEKRFEDAFRMFDARAVIGKLDANLRIAGADGNVELAAAGFLQGIRCVRKNLKKNMKELAGVAEDR